MDMKLYRPMETAMEGEEGLVFVVLVVVVLLEEDEEDGGGRVVVVRIRSPRMQTWGWMTARPPRMMCWVPWSWDRRATLLPVSVSM